MKRSSWVIVVWALMLGGSAVADQPQAEDAQAGTQELGREERYQKFTEQMTAVKLVGRFTVIGRDGPAAKDEYTIHKVEKLPEGDKWLIHARIQYGQHDLTVPIPLDVKWAGSTAVITLDDLTIPALGTFSSRVVIDDGKYAGTWRHDKVSGHMFGVIEKLSDDQKSDTKTKEKAAAPKG